MFSIEIQTAGQIGMKFGTEVVLKGRKVLGGGGLTQYPLPPGYGLCHRGYGVPLEPQPCILANTL